LGSLRIIFQGHVNRPALLALDSASLRSQAFFVKGTGDSRAAASKLCFASSIHRDGSMANERWKRLSALRELVKSKWSEDRMLRLIEEMRTVENGDPHTDRSAALIAGAILDQTLEEAISTHFVKPVSKQLFDGDNNAPGILGTNYAKIYVAYALEVIGPETLDDLNNIRIIRNAFAHFHGDLSFDVPQVANLCNFGIVDRMGPENWIALEGKEPKTPRQKFLAAIWLMALYLVDSPNEPGPKKYPTATQMPSPLFS
jgi:hypothetical protein